ncbi:MAG: ATP-binding cassette domain-containing protein, partial [Planctomycetaceae bacterium]|nr:ATP-binding cassette domain-containing protein [Planctomycetaceae bacterium]
MVVLRADGVTKTYLDGHRSVPVLRGISLSLSRGEVVALEGPSGSGKTTLLCILGCLLAASEGRVMIDGQEVDAQHPGRLWAIRRRSIGFVFQQFNLFPSLSASENVQYALNIRGCR